MRVISPARRARFFDGAFSSIAGLCALALALIPGLELWRFAVTSTALPQWDMAKYGASSLRLADAMRQLDVFGWLGAVHGLSTWPPTWPVAESLVFLVFGDGFGVARGLVAVTWMLSVVAAWWALRPLRPFPDGDAAGLLAAAWVAQSPLLQSLATVHLLEVPGTLLLLVCLGCALRALDDGETRTRERWWQATWLASLLLFFLKYNYGLLWLAPLLLAESVCRLGGWNALARAFWLRLRAVRWTAWPVFVVAYLVLLAAIRWSGGVDAEIFGQHVRATSVGNPAYLLLILLCLRQLLAGPDPWRRLRRSWRRLDHAWHGVCSWLVVPILLWMLLPPHVKEFFGFVENRSSAFGLVEALTFYPRMLLVEMARQPWIGVVVLGLSALSLPWLSQPRLRQQEGGGRLLLALAAVVACAALVLHPYKLSRFAVHAGVLLGALAAARLAGFLGGRWLWPARGLALACAIGSLVAGVDRASVEMQHRLRTVPAVAEGTALAAARVSLDGGIVLGTWNQLSPGLLEWLARQERELDAGWRPTTTFDVTRRNDARSVLRALAEPPCRPVAFVESKDPAWRSENAWLTGVLEELDSDPCRRAQTAAAELTIFACPQGLASEACRSR